MATAETARQLHGQGLARLFLLGETALVKHAKKNLHWPAKSLLALNRYTGLDAEALNAHLLLRAARDGFANLDCRQEKAWKMLVQRQSGLFVQKTQALYKLWQKMAEQLIAIAAMRPLPKAMAATEQDIEEQLQKLFIPDAWLQAPDLYLQRYPAYLEAILLRLQKAQRAPHKEALMLAEIRALWHLYWGHDRMTASSQVRWALEELRIALFAQEIKTAHSISPKKFRKMLEEGRSV
jgi:ATP-dependent helicase HrpA